MENLPVFEKSFFNGTRLWRWKKSRFRLCVFHRSRTVQRLAQAACPTCSRPVCFAVVSSALLQPAAL